MPTLTRRSSSTAARRAKKTEPIFIDLDEEDIAPTPTAPVIEPSEQDEEELQEKIKPAKRTGKRTAPGKKTASKAFLEASSMPVDMELTRDPPTELPIRRSVTMPISQVRSNRSMPMSEQSPMEPASLSSEETEANNKTGESVDEQVPSKKANWLGSNKTAPVRKNSASMLDDHLTSTSTPPAPETSISRQNTAVLSSYVPISTSTPTKLPSSSPMNTSASSNISPPSKLSSSSTSSLFRYKDSIDVHKVKSLSTLEDMDTLRTSLGIDKPKQSSSAQGHSFRDILTEIVDIDDSDDDVDDLGFSLSGPSSKKHCGPGRRASNVGSSSTTAKKHATSPKASSSSIYDPYGLVEEDHREPIMERTTTAKLPNTKSASPPTKEDPVRTTSGDSLLEEILGTRSTNRSSKPSPSSPSPFTGVASSYASSAQSLLAQTRQLLKSSQPKPPPPAVGYNGSGYSSYASSSYAPSVPTRSNLLMNVKLKVGPKTLDISVSPNEIISGVLNRLSDSKVLPVPLPKEVFILKFDGFALQGSDTVTNCNIGNGDELVLSVIRDGKEDPRAFDALDTHGIDGKGGDASDEEAEDPDKIELKAKFEDDSEVKWRLGRDEPLSKIAVAAAKRLNINPSQVRVKFDGVYLDLRKSPDDAELEQDDMVEISVAK